MGQIGKGIVSDGNKIKVNYSISLVYETNISWKSDENLVWINNDKPIDIEYDVSEIISNEKQKNTTLSEQF